MLCNSLRCVAKEISREMNKNMYYVPVLPYEMSSVNVQPLPNHHRVFFMERYKPLSFNGIQGSQTLFLLRLGNIYQNSVGKDQNQRVNICKSFLN